MLRIFWWLFKVFLVLGIIAGAVTYALFEYYSWDLPSYSQLAEYNPPSVTRIYSSDGKLIEEYAKENRVFVPIDNIPTSLIQAFISAEDKNFYDHQGIDILSLIRASFKNVSHLLNKKRMEGASTITQQVVKIFLLTSERSLARKIKEAILSFKISKVYSKDKILELYLNQTFLGNGSYGVATAAKRYFNKSLEELNLAESAFLASLPKFPSILNSESNYEKARTRRNYVIQRMLDDNYIGEEAALEAIESPIQLAKLAKEDRFEAGYYAEHVRNQVISMFSSDFFYTGGLTIITPLDSEHQRSAEKSFRNGIRKYDEKYGFKGPIANIANLDNWRTELKNYQDTPRLLEYQVAVVLEVLKDKVKIGLLQTEESSQTAFINLAQMKWTRTSLQHPKDILKKGDVIAVENSSQGYALKQIPKVDGATIVMDVSNGNVLAMVSGYDYKTSKFDRATQAERQPGSLIKPFVYLSALEHGIEPNTIFEDKPIEIYQGPGLPLYKPKNYKNDFLGSITMRTGLEKSRNTITVQLAKMVGLGSVAEIITRYGIDENPKKFYSMALGALETTLDKITSAYGSIANDCNKITPQFIEMIKDRNGKIIYKRDHRSCRGCLVSNLKSTDLPVISNPKNQIALSDEASCYQITSMLKGVVERGTAQSAKKLGKIIGGKTGTTNNSMDTWFVGFTPKIVIGTYVGFDRPKNMGNSATGGSVALPIFIDLMDSAFKNEPSLDFPVPQNITLIKTNSKTGVQHFQSEQGGIEEAVKSVNIIEENSNDLDPFNKIDSNQIPNSVEVY
jgi:penicillin-binding protein 1A